MSDELKEELNNQFTLLELMKLYLINNRTKLIDNGIERILDGKEIFRHELKKKKKEFKESINKDFNLMINYCENLDIKPLKNRKIINGFEPIYKDFYSTLHLYIDKEEIENEKDIKKMLKQTFKNFAKNDF